MSAQSSAYKKDGLKCFGNWVQVALLGSGGFGAVALWKHRLTNEQIAIKIFKDVKNKERSLQEIELTKRLNHENVVKLVPVPDDWKKLSSSILCMEYCAEGNLRRLLNKPENSSGLPENTVRRCLKNVKDGLEYIHSQNIIHRDIKPENVVLQKLNGEVVFKLIDFGYGVKCDKNSLEKLRTLAGTSDYVAPEVFIASDGYTISVDYWGFGFICFEIITGYRPFLPHLKATEWIAKVRHKTEEVICVYLLPYKTQGDSIVFSDDLPPENHLTKALASKLKLWLRLALRMDYRKRGYNKQNELIVFSFMEEILNRKVVTIFSSVVCELLSYDVDDSTTLLAMKERICLDTGHSIENQVFLSPSGEIVGDAAKVVDFWDPTNEIAMLFLLTREGVPLPFKEPTPPQSIVNLVEQGKEPSAYHCRKKVYSDSIYFIQTQLKLCKAFYKTIFIELLSVRECLRSLTDLEQNLRHSLIQCSAKLHLVQSSIQYNEKCYAKACESKVIIESRDFLGEKKEKILLLKSALKQTENKLNVFSDDLQEVTKKLDETCLFDYGDHNIEMLNKCLCTTRLGKLSPSKPPSGNIWEKVASEDFWCKLKCPPGTQHTMCQYSEYPSTPYCWDIRKQINAKVRSEILLWHNNLRDAVAGGALGKRASNMLVLSWDFELEQIANRWAHQCLRSKDKCRSTEHYRRVSQNVGWVTSHVDFDPPSREKILETWANTKEVFFDSHKKRYIRYQRAQNPFTIMIRACHERVGCGEVVYIQGEAKRRFLVCNYAPGDCLQYDSFGDHNDSTGVTRNKAFLVGDPCSRCPHGLDCHSYNTHYKYLCQLWYSNREENLFSPLELMEANSASGANCLDQRDGKNWMSFTVTFLFSCKILTFMVT